MIAFLLSPIGKFVGAAALLIALVVGFKLWLVNHDASVRSELVALYETKVAEAKTAEVKRQSDISSAVVKAANDKLAAAKAAEARTNIETEREISAYEQRLAAAKRDCLLDDSDLGVIMHHQ
jgi:hypothetical protein